MVGEQRLELVDHVATVGLESVGRVVVPVVEQDPDPRVDDPVEDELQPWVVVRAAALAETRAEGAVVSLLEHAVVEDQVLGRVREIGHHDRHGIPGVAIKPCPDRVSEAQRQVGAEADYVRVRLGDSPHDVSGPVTAGIVYDEDLVVDLSALELSDRARDGLPDRVGLVVGRNNDGKLHLAATHSSAFCSWISRRTSSMS